jgi:hypothetical protein
LSAKSAGIVDGSQIGVFADDATVYRSLGVVDTVDLLWHFGFLFCCFVATTAHGYVEHLSLSSTQILFLVLVPLFSLVVV